MKGRWPGRIFSRASSSVNHWARSTSGKDCRRPLFGGHSNSNRLDLSPARIEVAFDGKGGDDLPARLNQLAELDRVTCRRRFAELLFEFAAGDGERILALVIFALRDRPGAQILLRPERPAWMHEQQPELQPRARETARSRRFASPCRSLHPEDKRELNRRFKSGSSRLD